jgi:hypothetical protein
MAEINYIRHEVNIKGCGNTSLIKKSVEILEPLKGIRKWRTLTKSLKLDRLGRLQC